MKIVIIGLLVLLGFRGSSVGLVKDNETNGGVSGVTSVLLGSIFFSPLLVKDEKPKSALVVLLANKQMSKEVN